MNTRSFKKLWNWYPIDFHKKNLYPELFKAVIHIGKCDKICFSDYIYLMFFLFVCFSWSSLWKVIQCMSLSSFLVGKTEWQHWAISSEFVQSSLWSKYFVQATNFRRGHFNANNWRIYFNISLSEWASKRDALSKKVVLTSKESLYKETRHCFSTDPQ